MKLSNQPVNFWVCYGRCIILIPWHSAAMFTKTVKDDVSSFVCRLDKLVLKDVNEFVRILNAFFLGFYDRFFVQKT